MFRDNDRDAGRFGTRRKHPHRSMLTVVLHRVGQQIEKNLIEPTNDIAAMLLDVRGSPHVTLEYLLCSKQTLCSH